MCERTKRKRVGLSATATGMSDEFQVNIGRRLERALTALLYITVIALVSRKISMKCVHSHIMNADDMAEIAYNTRELKQQTLEEL